MLIQEEIGEKEIQSVIEINGVKIGIESQGDPNSRLFKSLPLFVDTFHCQLIVCATRTSGGTKNAVKHLESKGYEIEFIEKKASMNECDNANKEMGREIFSRLQKILDNP